MRYQKKEDGQQVLVACIILSRLLVLENYFVSQLPVATAPPAATIACATVWTTFRTLS